MGISQFISPEEVERGDEFTLKVWIQDQFYTTLHGNYLLDHDPRVVLTQSNPGIFTFPDPDLPYPFNPESGKWHE